MGILGYLSEARGSGTVSLYELNDWSIFNPLVHVVHCGNIHVHIVKYKLHPRRQDKNRLLSFLTQQPVYGDAFMYGVNDMNEIVHKSALERFLRDMIRMMNGIPVIENDVDA
jgi:hypothetical protein